MCEVRVCSYWVQREQYGVLRHQIDGHVCCGEVGVQSVDVGQSVVKATSNSIEGINGRELGQEHNHHNHWLVSQHD